MNFYKQVILLFTVFFAGVVIGQDKIQLMNGKVLRGKLKTEYDDYYNFEYYKNGGKVKSIELSKFRMFSVTNGSEPEKVLYKQDTLLGNFYSENEMRMFVYGQRDAFNSVKGTSMFMTTFLIGFGSVLIDTYEFQTGGSQPQGFFNHTPSVGPIIVPFALTIGAGLLRSKVRKEYVTDVTFLASEYYIEGFQKVAKVKRVKSAFLGSIGGVITGFLVYSIAKP